MQTIDLSRLIDDGPFRGARVHVAVLCFLAVLLDGFDTQAIGYIAPALVRDWHLARSTLGPLFACSLLGLTCGALICGPLADKWGRKPVLIGSVAVFGLLSLATAGASSLPMLLLLRFLTGMGLGGVMPNAVALTSEYAPARIRATVVMIMFCGFSIGAALGGVLAASVISSFGWRAVFVVGGLAPLLLLPLLLWLLPESLQLLLATGKGGARVLRIAQRLAPEAGFAAHSVFTGQARNSATRFPVAALFADGRALRTLMLWVIFFASLFELYFISNWLPLLLNEAGFPPRDAVLVATLFQIGGTVGTLVLGTVIDKWRPFMVLAAIYLAAALFVSGVGASVSTTIAVVATVVFLAGFCVVGGQIGANAMAAYSYPTAIRATGVGWALGVGRIGSIIGPTVGGALLVLHWDPTHIFLLGAIPVLLAGLAALVIHLSYRPLAATAYLPERVES